MIDRAAVETEPDVKVELLSLCESPGAPAIEQVRGALMIVVCDVLHESIAMGTKFSLQRKSRFKRWGFLPSRWETK